MRNGANLEAVRNNVSNSAQNRLPGAVILNVPEMPTEKLLSLGPLEEIPAHGEVA